MVYKNIDIHNIAEIVEDEDGCIGWLRVPKHVYDGLYSDQGRNMCRGNTGVEFRFVMKGDSVTLKLRPTSKSGAVSFNVFFGGLQAGWQYYGEGGFVTRENPCIVINKPKDMETLKKISSDSGYDFDPEVVRVVINKGVFNLVDVEGDVCPPEKSQLPKKTILTYGSSITHGSNGLASSISWPSMVAHNLNADLINLGMAGSCGMEAEMMDYIASLGEKDEWTTAILELGINVLAWDEEKIHSHVSNAITQIAGRNPDKGVYVVSPFYCHNDYYGNEDANKWRRCIEDIVKELAYPNVEYINGLDILGDVSGLSADEVHPNIYGINRMISRFTERIKV